MLNIVIAFMFIACATSERVFVEGKCPDGWISTASNPSNCYNFVKEKMNWMHAEQYCLQNGAHLVTIQNAFDNIFVNSHAHTIFTDSSDFWIGANNFASSDAVWSWIDNSALIYEEWDKYEFQNTSSSLCGAVVLHKNKWITTNCLNNKPFVCMLRNPDWTYFKGTGYFYKVYNISTTWENAEKICVQANSHLISIHSPEELTFATEFVSPFSTNACLWRAQTWIGMFTINNNQNWLWTDGTAFDYSKWAPYEPDNPGGQNCGNIWTGKICDHWQNTMFYNHGCSIPMNNFICKKGH